MPQISWTELESHLQTAFESHGVVADVAAITASSLVLAEADGVSSHGVSRVPAYLAQVDAGKVKADAEVDLHWCDTTHLHVDAGLGFAFPALSKGLDASLKRLADQSIVLLTIGHSHHAGVLGHPVEVAARAGFLAIAVTNTPAAIAPWGGSKALFGTNPLAFASPRSTHLDPLVIDLSVSAVARGKVVQAAIAGESIPDNWALDEVGDPTTDPTRALSGSMRPLGDAKGAGLALMIEILAGALTGSNFGHEASSFLDAAGESPDVGQCFILVNPARVAAGFSDRVEILVSAMLAQDGVRLPGARRFQNRERARKAGFFVADALWEEIART